MTGTRLRTLVVLAALLAGLTACEGTIEFQVEQLLGPDAPESSRTLKDQARAHSAAMCAAGTVSSTPDPAAVYGPGSVELVDSEPLDPGLEPPDDDHAATNAIWLRWRDDPRLTEREWRWMAAGEAMCDDGRLYTTLVLLPLQQLEGTIDLVARAAVGASQAPSLSADGRWVAFNAPGGLLPGGTYGSSQIFLWDRTTGTVRRLTDGFGDSYSASISADGSVVSFVSQAFNLAPGDQNLSGDDVYVWTRATGWIGRVTGGNSLSERASVSADGRWVAFSSFSSNLVPGDDNESGDVFLWDRTTRLTTRITAGNGSSGDPSISGDGSVVAFSSAASDLVPGDVNGVSDVFLWERTTGSFRAVAQGDRSGDAPAISDDGRYVAWHSFASDIVPGDTGGHRDVFRWDSVTGEVDGVTVGASSASLEPDLTSDGGIVAFYSYASDLVPGDANSAIDVFLWDAATDSTTRLTDGVWDSVLPSVSADGSRVAFQSAATDLVEPDENGYADVYLWTAP